MEITNKLIEIYKRNFIWRIIMNISNFNMEQYRIQAGKQCEILMT